MLRKLVCASVLLVLFAGVALADEIRAVITNVDAAKNTVTFKEYKAKAERGPERTLPAANAKVKFAKFNWNTMKTDPGDLVPGSLTNSLFDDKGLSALIITDGENNRITEIRVFPKRKER